MILNDAFFDNAEDVRVLERIKCRAVLLTVGNQIKALKKPFFDITRCKQMTNCVLRSFFIFSTIFG